jgi:hypothetical protein
MIMGWISADLQRKLTSKWPAATGNFNLEYLLALSLEPLE